jgi:glycosyltransferase involved in cell wall biosynthesis
MGLIPPVVDASGEVRALKVMFLLTSMPVGGAETLVANLVRKMDRVRFAPEICCLKEPGPIGEELAQTCPVRARLLAHKYDLRVLPRLTGCLKKRVDAVVTVGAGDKMFWGRLAAHWSAIPVVISALHSTGWPDGLGRLNRLLTPWTDAFVAVASDHGRFLIDQERLPADKVRVIPNGVDLERFRFDAQAPSAIRHELGLSGDTPLCGIVAALRPEKNHQLFLQVAQRVLQQIPQTHFLIVGDGPRRAMLRDLAADMGLEERIHFLGNRSDIPRILSALNVFLLSSENEANPVSILEALAVQVPVVATAVGSVAATVKHGETGFLAPSQDAIQLATHVIRLLRDPHQARACGAEGRREVAAHWSLERMVRGYEQLILEIYHRKRPRPKMAGQAADGIEFCGATP